MHLSIPLLLSFLLAVTGGAAAAWAQEPSPRPAGLAGEEEAGDDRRRGLPPRPVSALPT